MITYFTILTYANDWHNHRRDRDTAVSVPESTDPELGVDRAKA